MYYAQLRAFHGVASHGGFSKAAKELRLTQPCVSEHVRALESNFGVLLFNRRTRGPTEPTELGERLLAITRRMFDTETEAIHLLRETQVLKQGFLSIAADGPTHAIPLIAKYRQQYPGVSVTLNTGNTAEVLARLLNYEADLVVAAQFPKVDRLKSMSLRRDPMVAYVAKSHPWASRRSISLSEFEHVPIILREKGSVTRRLLEEELLSRNIPCRQIFEVDGQDAARAAVAAGIGIGIISIPELGTDPRLKPLRLKDCHLEMEEIVACLEERQHLRIIESFLELARSSVKEKRKNEQHR